MAGICESQSATIYEDNQPVSVLLQVCIDSPANGDQIAGNGPITVPAMEVPAGGAPGSRRSGRS